MKTKLTLILGLMTSALGLPAFAQGSAFTYQGVLQQGGTPTNGAHDLTFTLYTDLSGGGIVGASNVVGDLPITNGLFTVTLDFGAGAFDGAARWLQIAVRPGASAGAYTILSPRQALTPTPYAIYAATAGTASNVFNGSVVQSLNGLKDNVTLAAGSNVTISPSGSTLTISSAGASGSGIWSLNGASTYYNGGNVGIGTNTPAHKLTVRTPTTDYGIEHTDGNVRLSTFVGGSTGGGWLGTISTHPLSFFVNDGGASMTVDTTGNVGIGTITPGSKLEVAGRTRIKGRLDVNSGLDYTLNGLTMLVRAGVGDTAPIWVVDSANGLVFNLIVGSPNLLQMYGNASKTDGGTSWSTFSDRRLKQGVRAYEPGLNEVLQLRPVRFHYRDGVKLGLNSAREEVGFVAQEVREVIPDAVAEGRDGYLTLKADPIHWAAINAIQELNAKLEEQRAENAELKRRLDKLERLLQSQSSNH